MVWEARSPHACTWALLLAAALSGCLPHEIRVLEGEAATPVPLTTALSGVEEDLRKSHPVVLSDVDGTDRGDAVLKAAIRAAQCLARKEHQEAPPNPAEPPTPPNSPPPVVGANPLVPVLTGPAQITLQGQIAIGGTFTVSGTGPSGGATVTRQAQQQLMLPVTFVATSNLADFYLGQQLTVLQYTTLLPKDDPGLAKIIKRIVDTRNHIWDVASSEISTYSTKPTNETDCKAYIQFASGLTTANFQ